MTTAIFKTEYANFAQWLSEQRDYDEIAICGIVDLNDAASFDLLTTLNGKSVDISQLYISAYGHLEYERVLDAIEDIACFDGKRPSFLLVLYANKEECSRFYVLERDVVSSDGTTLIYSKVPEDIISINPGIKYIGDYSCMFSSWSSYTKTHKLTIAEGVVSIGKYAFKCSPIYEVLLPTTLKTIGDSAFASTDIEEIVIPEGVEVLPLHCFEYCFLREIHFPSSLKVIEGRSIMLYGNIEKLVIPEGVVQIDSDAIDGLERIFLPSTVIDLADDFYYEDMVDDGREKPYIIVHRDNPRFYSHDGKIYEKGHTEEYIPYRKNKYASEK